MIRCKSRLALMSVVSLLAGSGLLASGKAQSQQKPAAAKATVLTQPLWKAKGHNFWVNGIAFSPDGQKVCTASGGEDNTAKVWDAQTGKLLATLKGHTGGLYIPRFSSDGKRILTPSADQTARLWDAETGKTLFVFEGYEEFVLCAAFSPDDKKVVICAHNTVEVRETDTGKSLLRFKPHKEGTTDAYFSPDGARLITLGGWEPAKEWDAETGKLLHTHKHFDKEMSPVILSPDRRLVATYRGDSNSLFSGLLLADTETNKKIRYFPPRFDGTISQVFSQDGKRLLIGYSGKAAVLWEVATGKELLVLKGHSQPVRSVAVSPDGSRLATGCDDGVVRVWKVEQP